MIRIDIDTPSRRVLRSLSGEQLHTAIERGVRQGLYMTGKAYSRHCKDELKKPKNGRVYRVKLGKRRVTYRASAPGEYPAKLTGALRRSVDFRILGAATLEFGAGGLDVPYAKWLEEGTSKMAARPYLRPTITSNDAVTRRLLRNRILWAIRQEARV